MKNRKRVLLIIFAVMIFALTMGFNSIAYSAINPTKITVVLENNYPPYAFLDGDGKLKGITIDQWKLFEANTGIKVEITGMERDKALSEMKNGKFNVIDTISYSEERETFLDFSNAYATIAAPGSDSLYTSNFYRAVKDGNKELLDIINKGFTGISAAEYSAIDKRWFGSAAVPLNNETRWKFAMTIGVIIVIVIGVLSLSLFVWSRLLKRKVIQKTKELTLSLEEIKTSENTFRKLFEESSDPIIILDLDKVIDCNQASLAYLGYSGKNDIVGKSFWELSPKLQPDGLLSSEKIYDYLRNSEHNKSKFEWLHERKDGTNAFVEIMMTTIILKGKRVFHALMRDINDRKQMELKLEFMSYHDQLTELYNRRFFEEELKRLDSLRNYPLTIVMADVNGLKLINDSFGHNFGDELLKKVAYIIAQGCRSDDIIARLGGDEFVILLPKTDGFETEQIIRRIKKMAASETLGSVSISISFGWETKLNPEENIAEIFKKAEDYMYKEKLFESPSMRGKTIHAIISALHEKNKREEQHSHRVSTICMEMGHALGMFEGEIQELKTVGLLHDIGKIAIEESILNKPGKLNKLEWEDIIRHPEIGYRILSTVNDMAEMAEYVLAHHEKWDGSGYPKGLIGEAIPLKSRIIAIADTFDAITSERSYRSGLTKEFALSELNKYSGTQFDPELIKIFTEVVFDKI